MRLDHWAPITIDPGPHAAVLVNWQGARFTFVRGGTDGETQPPQERPKIKIPPKPGSPVRALRLDEAALDAFLRGDEEGLGWEELDVSGPTEDDGSDMRDGEAAVPEWTSTTVLFRIEGTNVVDLDQLEPYFREPAMQGAGVLIEFV